MSHWKEIERTGVHAQGQERFNAGRATMKFKRMLIVGVLALAGVGTAMAYSSQLDAVQVKESEKQVVIDLKTTGSFAHKEYRADQHLMLVDLTDVTPDSGLMRELTRSSALLKGYKVLTYTSASGADMTRISLQLGDSVTVDVKDQAPGLEVVLSQSPAPAPATAASTADAPASSSAADGSVPAYAQPMVKNSYQVLPSASAAAPAASQAPVVSTASAAPQKAAEPQGSEPAASIVGVSAQPGPDGVDLSVVGAAHVHAFMLKNPYRLVMDFENAVLKTSVRKLAVSSPDVSQVRVSPFQAKPPVTRIVVDLSGPHAYEVLPAEDHVLVHIKAAAATQSAKSEMPATAASAKVDTPSAPPVNASGPAEDVESKSSVAPAVTTAAQPAAAPPAKTEAAVESTPAPATAKAEAAHAEADKPQTTSIGDAFAPMIKPAAAPPSTAQESAAKVETSQPAPSPSAAPASRPAVAEAAVSAPIQPAPAATAQPAVSAAAQLAPAQSSQPVAAPAQPVAVEPVMAQVKPALAVEAHAAPPVQPAPQASAPAQPVASAAVQPAPAQSAQPVVATAQPVAAQVKPAPAVEAQPVAKLAPPPQEAAREVAADSQSAESAAANNPRLVAARFGRAADLAPAATGGAVRLHPQDQEPASSAAPTPGAYRAARQSVALARLQQPVSQNDTATNNAAAGSAKYTGEPISVNLKDVDLKDFFRLIHEISGLNIVLDPNVHGTVTLVLDDVPWDQALDIVLKNNSLDRELQGNVLRIASTDTLRKEAVDRRAQSEALALAVDRQTITRVLSYAKAKEVLPTLKKFLSARGDIIQDDRTNSIIISDIPSVIPNLDRLIEKLDRKSQEVEIEVRVVSATRSFSRDLGAQLGVQWGNGVTTVAGSNPNGSNTSTSTSSSSSSSTSSTNTTTSTVSTASSIPLFTNFPVTGAGTGLMLSNITHSYGIDAILEAAEQHNLAKVLSRPRIVTQSNVKAEVKQGSKLPVYQASTSTTNATVSYIDAVLRLSVTPQITNERTIFLTVDVENTQPNGQNNGNYILTTQQATTQVLVTDGGTVVIGGVIQTTNSVSVQQTPVLGNIPWLGNLFKERLVKTETDELIFFITPKIIET